MKSKVKQSTEKPFLGEMRLIGGRVMVWSGKQWITQNEWHVMTANKINNIKI